MSHSVQVALALLQRGDLGGALAAFEALLQEAPEDIAVLAGYASALRRVGRLDEALTLWCKARDCAPADPGVCFNHANALRAAGQLDAARLGYERALQLAPGMLPARINLGLVLQDQGHFEAAVEVYAAALAIDPRQPTAAMNRGNCLRQLGRLEEAIAQHRSALDQLPRSAEARYNLGNALRDAARIDEALDAYRAALQAGPAPLQLWTRLGVSLQDLGASEAALAAFDRGRREHPQASLAHCNFGHMAMRLRRPKDAIEALRRALELEPGEPLATSHLVDALVRTGFLSEAIGLADAALRQAQGDTDASAHNRNERLARLHNVLGNACVSAGNIDQAIAHLGEARRLQPDARSISNLLFASLYREDLGALQKARLHQQETECFGDLDSSHARAVGAPAEATVGESATPASLADASPGPIGATERRLRIGYLSADLAEHPVGYFMQPLLREHDRARFELFVYSDVESPDALTAQIQAGLEHWVAVCGYSDQALARRIRDDRIDVLIELSGHTAGNRLPLLARRVAPVQISYLGYPFSTGLSTLDAIFGDAITTPESDAALYRERLLRLPHFPFCMQPHASAPPVAPLPAIRNGHLTFGCFNNLAKVGSATLALWARLLQALPDARLLLRAVGLNDGPTCDRLRRYLASQGIDAGRLELLPPIRPISAYLDGYGGVDIALDPLAYNGGTTSFEALWQGVPVLTLPGAGFCARMGAGINATAGLDAFTARDAEHFLSIARDWNTRREQLAELRAGLRQRLIDSPLFNGARFMPAFEAALNDLATSSITHDPQGSPGILS